MARKPRPYHCLLTRQTVNIFEGPQWFLEFGDYDRDAVEFEREEYRHSFGYPAKNLRIITTSDRQADIDAAIAKLNGKAA
ncbi:hypothetical protein [Labrys neptuniae]